MSLLLFYMGLALTVSFFCSLLEAVILSVTPSYVDALTEQKHPAGVHLRSMKRDIERSLAAILSLNTIANTIGAVGVGAQAAQVFGGIYVGIASGVLTLLILILAEIIPKTLGAVYWRTLAPPVARVVTPLTWLMYPFVKLSTAISGLIAPGDPDATMSRDELLALARIAAAQGQFAREEFVVLENLMRFGATTARQIATPRTVVFALPETETVGEVLERCEEAHFSRIPIYKANLDEVSGYVLRDEVFLSAAQEDLDPPLHELRRDIIAVPGSLRLPLLLEQLLQTRSLIALVVDEFGGTLGVVTVEDVVETLLGTEIVDEIDEVPDMQAHARRLLTRRLREASRKP